MPLLRFLVMLLGFGVSADAESQISRCAWCQNHTPGSKDVGFKALPDSTVQIWALRIWKFAKPYSLGSLWDPYSLGDSRAQKKP